MICFHVIWFVMMAASNFQIVLKNQAATLPRNRGPSTSGELHACYKHMAKMATVETEAAVKSSPDHVERATRA